MNDDKKYFLDLDKLKKKSVYVLRYKKYPHTYKTTPLLVNQDVRTNILSIVNNQFHRPYFDKLNKDEQKLIHQFAKYFDFEIYEPEEEVEETDDLLKQYEITRGSYLAGNDSPIIKQTLKSQIMKLMDLKKVGKIKGMSMLYELSIV